ncbi:MULTISPECIES: patatin-like phospholipase family protein [Winogradskyella]|uniref:patatin-like phospholipase family protein n=1 Tax=Winogradskyella TaxID=286104 RepID=UPI0015CE3E9B|nr:MULTISPECIES: patatin-like phospholipase family protein [Winogradskyella]QXP79102.1 patatin-like phospholipase family protein [Winogradskyella sp. HaHa_3_26]
MIILIVDDSDLKIAKIKTVINETDKSPEFLVAKNKADAMTLIRSNPLIDLMILDLNLPNRVGENPKRLAGLSFLRELNRREKIVKPNHIIGLTAYSELKSEVTNAFEQNGWVVITYDTASALWEETIKNKIEYISSNKNVDLIADIEDKNNDFVLIMKGGGIKGLAYVGALEELTKYYEFNWYAGTSAGAISAILLGAGYNHDELNDILQKNNFNKFKDSKFFFDKIFNLIFKGGLYNADTFTLWMQELLSRKLESSSEVKLENLKYRVSVYASTQGKKALVYDSLDPKTKETPAAFAARCSMSIPFVFTPQQNNGYKVFDGGTQNNYPVEILLEGNPNTNFIGLYLGDEYFRGKKKKYILNNLVSIWTESNDNEVLEKYKEETIVIDPKPISTLQFSLNEQEKQFLQECGRLGALKFLKKNKKIEIDDTVLKERKEQLELLRERLTSIKLRKRRKKSIIIISSLVLLLILSFIGNIDFFNQKEKNIKDSPEEIRDSVQNENNYVNKVSELLNSKEPKIIHPGLSLQKGKITNLKLFPTDIIKVIYGKSLDSIDTGLGWQNHSRSSNPDGYIVTGETGKYVSVKLKGEGVIKMIVEISNYKDSIRGTDQRPWE